MKKTFKGLLLAIPALLGLGFTACQNEEAELVANSQTGEKVYVSLEASLPGDVTRATFAPESETSRILKFAWEENDVISVVNSENGKWLGSLKVKEVKSDKTKCTFAGNIIDPGTNCTLKFYYLDSKTLPREGADVKPLTIDFSNQNGTSAQFGETDILISTKTYTDGVKGQLGTVMFDRDFAYAKFVLKYNGKELNLSNADVTISAEEGSLYNYATLDLQHGTYTYSNVENNNNILVAKPGNNFYVKFFPAENITLKFTCTVNIDGKDEEFVGTRSTSDGNLVKNLYYTEKGTGLSMIVEMTHSDGRDIKYDVKVTGNLNYEGSTPIDGKTINTTLPCDYVLGTNLENPTRPNYTFKGWGATDDATVADKITSVKFNNKEDREKVVYAIWEKNTIDYQITLKDDDPKTPATVGTPSTEDSQDVTLPTPSKDGFEFLGWKEEGADDSTKTKGPWTLTVDKPQVTLVPVWNKLPTVTTPGYDHGDFYD